MEDDPQQETESTVHVTAENIARPVTSMIYEPEAAEWNVEGYQSGGRVEEALRSAVACQEVKKESIQEYQHEGVSTWVARTLGPSNYVD